MTRTVLTIAHREFTERLRDRAFLVSTGLVVLFILALMVLPRLFGVGEPPAYTVALAGQEAAALAEPLAADARAAGLDVTVRQLPDRSAAEAAVRAEEVDLAVVDGDVAFTAGEPSAELAGLVQGAVRETRIQAFLDERGIPAEQAGAVLAPAPLDVRVLDPAQAVDPARVAVAQVGALVLYLQLFTFGYWVAAGVVEEKSSRVVEVLLAAVRPWQLLTGKVIGIGLLGLVQVSAFAAVGLAAGLWSGIAEVPSDLLGPVASVVLFFLLGYVFWSWAYAVAGVLAARQEDLQASITPLSFVIIASFLVASFVDPDSDAGRVASLVPPVTPLLMPVRIATGSAAAWEVALGAGLLLAASAVMIPLATRIYGRAALRTRRTRLVDVLGRR